MRRIGNLILILSLLLLGLAGCSSSKESQADQMAYVDDKTPITIQYWHSHGDDQKEAIQFMIKEFEKKYPWITIEPVFQGGYPELHKKLLAAVAAKQVPAVANVEVSALPNFADSQVFADLSPYIQRDQVDLSDFAQGMRKAYAFEGTQYGLPLIVSTSVFIYNKTMLDKAGVEPPQNWDEIEPFARKLTDKEGNTVTRYAFSVPGWDTWYYDPWIINGGGSILTEDKKAGIDQEKSMKFMNLFKDWKEKGYLHIGYGKGASDTMRQMFFDGKIGMVQHTSALIKYYVEKSKFEIGVSFLPGDEKRISQIGGAGIAIMDLAKNREKEAAWKFVKFMTSSEYNIKWAEKSGYLPTRKSAIDSEDGKEYFAKYPQYKAVFDNFDNVAPRDQHPAYPEFSTFYKTALGKVVLENKEVEPAFKQAAKQINDALKEFEENYDE